MSQKTTRKAVIDDKDKKPLDTPVVEQKKKSAAATMNQEKENKSADKIEKAGEKSTDKKAEKNGVEKDKKPESKEKNLQTDKDEKTDKNAKQSSAKPGTKDAGSTKDSSQASNPKPTAPVAATVPKTSTAPANANASKGTNGAQGANGNSASNGIDVVSLTDSEDDEVFPELLYDDSDMEPALDARALTRRAQVKLSRTPETPRPASDKQIESTSASGATDNSKDSKLLQMKESVPANTERKLRSADSPKPETKKPETPKKDKKEEVKENGGKLEMEVTVEVDHEDESGRKPDTNYSKSRVKVSPYRRSGRLHDQTNSSLQANYTGNNTTMEMDITASSVTSEQEPIDDSYLRTIRGMRGRRSYKLLKDIQITHRSTPRIATPTQPSLGASESTSRPTAPVVGRKRKPDGEDTIDIELASEAGEIPMVAAKRMRLLDRISLPFRRGIVSQPLAHRASEIVGINTDLPLTAPLAAARATDPETLKAVPTPAALLTGTGPTTVTTDRDGKRCLIM